MAGPLHPPVDPRPTSTPHYNAKSPIRTCALELVEQHLETLDPNTPEALTAAVVVLKTLPAAEVPTLRPEPAETLATRDLSSIRFSLHTDPYEQALFPVAVSPLRLMLDAAAD